LFAVPQWNVLCLLLYHTNCQKVEEKSTESTGNIPDRRCALHDPNQMKTRFYRAALGTLQCFLLLFWPDVVRSGWRIALPEAQRNHIPWDGERCTRDVSCSGHRYHSRCSPADAPHEVRLPMDMGTYRERNTSVFRFGYRRRRFCSLPNIFAIFVQFR